MEVTQVFRPVTMKDWFMIDPVLNKVSPNNKVVSGVRAEVAEAVGTPEGLVIWRISGVAQKAETAVELEDGRQRGSDVVHIGTIKVDPIKLLCAPKRIVSRSVVEVAPMSLVVLDRLDKHLRLPAGKISSHFSLQGSELKEYMSSIERPAVIKFEGDVEEEEDESEGLIEWNDDVEFIQPSDIKEEIMDVLDDEQSIEIPVELASDISRGAKRKIEDEVVQSEKRMKDDSEVRNRPVLDPDCKELRGVAHLYEDNGDSYDIMLNQTNVEFNNNKYYLLQLLKRNSSDQYYVWFRWGRVGKRGQTNLLPCGSNLEKARSIFEKKFFDKTGNNFHERHSFEKLPRKYDMVRLADYQSEKEDPKENIAKLANTKENYHLDCALPKDLKDFVELICNIKRMEKVLRQLDFDSKRTPLGQLTRSQIIAGFEALKRIEDFITNNITGPRLIQACNDFYTRIPHDFGMRVPPILRTREQIQEKVELLETLTDVKIAIELLQTNTWDNNVHPADRHYISLNIRLELVDSKELEFITNYLQTTHAPTHNQYIMTIEAAFRTHKAEEISRFRSDLPNRMLLWHGSRLSNWASILSQGLRIAPEEAPSTGYMFGKGVYFADCSSKSANYCFPSTAHSEGVLLLSEVALGNMQDLYEANYEAERLCLDSVRGVGRIKPDIGSNVIQRSPFDGKEVVVPCGKLEEIQDQDELRKCTLNYNEYIVYNVNQMRMRYALRVKFHFC